MPLRRSEYLLCLCAGGLLLLTLLGRILQQPVIGAFGIGYGIQLDRFVAVETVQSFIYFAAVLLVLRGDPQARFVWLILGCAVLLRLAVLLFPPFLSNDMYRYIWDGWVQAAGINPYRYVPADPHVAFLRDHAIYPNINRANYAVTIYPPAAEMFFFGITRIAALLSLSPVFILKLGMVVMEGIGVWAILRLLKQAALPLNRILIYTWNPLPIYEFAGNGHVDAIAICLIALALLAASSGRNMLSAAALAGAVLTKFLPMVIFPAIWRRWDWRFAAVFTGLIVLLYAPYLSVGARVFGFIGGYSAEEGIASGAGIFPVALLGRIVNLPPYAATIYLAALAASLLALGALIVFHTVLPVTTAAKTKTISSHALLLGSLLMAGISPHFPWYYCWLLIPACIIPWPSTLYLVTASFLLYLNPIHTKVFWPAFVYLPFLALAARDIWMGKTAVFRDQEPREGAKI